MTQAPTPGPLTFGAGKLVVDTGHYAGSPAVVICPAKVGGPVGASAQVENNPTDCLQPNETVLTFPTMEQAKSVADALVLAPTAPVEASGSERSLEANIGWFVGRARKDGFHAQADWLERQVAHLCPQPSGETRSFVMSAEDAPVWADGIVTDGERVAMAQKAEADYGGTYWATDDSGDGAVEWEPTHFIDLNALLSARPAPVASGGQHSSGEGEE